jgi:uncharacterized protein (TIRG00374 family)
VVKQSVPIWISRVAITVAIGLALLFVTVGYIDRDATLEEARRLGPLLPVVLLPSAAWHLIRTLGWFICFPLDARPTFWQLFRVRLAADAVSYFTIRGLASEPLRVVLLLDHVPAPVSTAATILERTAMGVMSVVIVATCAAIAMSSDVLPRDWQQLFRYIAIGALGVILLTAVFFTRRERYLGPLLERMYKRTGWTWTEGRVARFIREVEHLFLMLAHQDSSRLRRLVGLSLAAFAVMVVEVWVIFWAIGIEVSLWRGAIAETFTRVTSIPGGVIPASLGAMEASNVAVARALGIASAGSFALARRVRSLVWAVLGLLLYPRDTLRTHPKGGP